MKKLFPRWLMALPLLIGMAWGAWALFPTRSAAPPFSQEDYFTAQTFRLEKNWEGMAGLLELLQDKKLQGRDQARSMRAEDTELPLMDKPEVEWSD